MVHTNQDFLPITKDDLKLIIQEVLVDNLPLLLDPYIKTIKNRLLTRNEAATYLGISLVTLHNWTMRGIVKATRISTRVRYYKEDLDKALVYIQTETGNRA